MRASSRWRRLAPVAVVLLWLLVGGALAPSMLGLDEVAVDDQASFVPASSESARANHLLKAFDRNETITATVVWVAERGREVSGRQQALATEVLSRVARATPGVAGQAGPVLLSQDRRALQAVLPLRADLGAGVGGVLDKVRTAAGKAEGLRVEIAGPAAEQADLLGAFDGIDGPLLAVALAVVVLILLAVYRSVLLPVIVIVTAVLALVLACAVVRLLAGHGLVHIDGQVQGLLFILVIGAGTDYALLLAARFREELARGRDRFTAMPVAWRRSAGAVCGSAATVALAVLALCLSDLRNNQAMGPAGAVGIVCAMVASLTFLPAVLMLLGRVAYWPTRPRSRQAGDRPEGTPGGTPARTYRGRSVWRKVAVLVDRHPRRLWTATLVALLSLAAFSPMLTAHGLPLEETFVGGAPSVTGRQVLSEHFAAGAGNPAMVVARAGHAGQVLAAVRATPGVAQATVLTDGQGRPGQGGPGRSAPLVAGGRVAVQATLADVADSDAAKDTLGRLRSAVHAVPGADAVVGGYTAELYDTQTASSGDLGRIIPVVLLIIFLVLVVLLRGLLLPAVLVATVALNYLAAVGMTALLFTHGLGFDGTDPAVPLYGFVFLVALGVDYNIFLMTRVREEALHRGTRAGVLRGLAATGGVITSAGVVLAATFAALVVIPVAFMAQMAFIVAFGVLLDTVVVRSLLVPALVRDIGAPVWWPGRVTEPARVPAPPGPPDETARTRATEAA